ncbi:FMR1-interacting protein NUFIP1 isoform X2 [Vanacampus margaritifer]
MDKLGSYPPPNFDCPPPNTIQLPQPQPPASKSNFHPSMWTWLESPCEPEPTWAYGSQTNWNHRPASGAAVPSQNHGSQNSHGREWYHTGQQNGSKPAGNRGKKRQIKMEPEFKYFCDTCDRGFKNQEKYDEHVAQHVKCSVPDCSFTAHEKIVNIHWKNTHAPGMKRIKLDTAEEIAKWREDRRKNYPTLQNIEKKRKLMQEREKTGAVLETAQFGRMRGRGRGTRRGRGHRRFQGQRHQNLHPSDAGAAAERPPPLIQPGQNGDPLGVLVKSDIESDKDDADADSRTAGLVVVPKQMSSAMASLVASYGSMSDSDTDEAQDSTVQTAKVLVQENKDLLVQNRPFMDTKNSTQDTQASKVSCPWSALNAPNNPSGRGRRGRRRGRRRCHDMPQKRRPTLLEMLLASDIRHERNVLLQCVRYVVRNDFFGLEKKTQPQLGIKRTQAPGSSDHKVRIESGTLSDSVDGSKSCFIEGGTSSAMENAEIGPANETTKITVVHCLTQNSLDQEPLADQADSGLPDDKTLLGSTDSQSGTTCDQAGSGLSCPGVESTLPSGHRSVQKSNNYPVDSLASAEQVAEDQEEKTATSDHHSHDSMVPYESKSTNIYDDEIWEMPN